MDDVNIIRNRFSWQQKPEASGAHVQLVQTRDSLVKCKPQSSKKL